MRKVNFYNGGFYHIYNRGVLKQPIFFEDRDYIRFVHDLYEFNDLNHSVVPRGRKHIARGSTSGIRIPEVEPLYVNRSPRDKVVAILAWCLMPNHFHLFLQQIRDGGVSVFMHKLSTGYTAYINKKYKRTGHLFQGRFKAKHIGQESYFLHISRYIHLNPVDLIESGWKEEGIKDWEKVHQFLENYKWSSYPDWIGSRNFPSLLDLKSVTGVFDNADRYKRFMGEWAVENYRKLKDIVDET